jgi:hypothetical protein
MTVKQKIGDRLVAAGAIDEAQLAKALVEQKQLGRPLGMTLIRMGFLDEQTLIHVLASQLKLPVVKLAGKIVNPEVLDRVPIDLAEKTRCLPLLENDEGGDRVLYLGMEDPADLDAVEEVGRRIGMTVKPVLVAPSELDEALHRHYHWAGSSTNPAMTTELDPFDPHAEAVGDLEFVELPSADEPAQPSTVSAGSGATSARSSEVPAESILRALTQLLIEKGVITRDELVERVQTTMRSEDGDIDA